MLDGEEKKRKRQSYLAICVLPNIGKLTEQTATQRLTNLLLGYLWLCSECHRFRCYSAFYSAVLLGIPPLVVSYTKHVEDWVPAKSSCCWRQNILLSNRQLMSTN
jgi:hypothetical protein